MNNTIKYDPTIIERKQNIFVEEYFSGADCNIYINDKLYDNIAGISCTVQEQLKPLYGYASRVYDDVAVGNRIVIGTVRVPVKNTENTTTGIMKGTLDFSDINTPVIPNTPSTTPLPDWVEQTASTNKTVSTDITAYPPQTDTLGTIATPIEITDTTNILPSSGVMDVQTILTSEGYPTANTGVIDKTTTENLINYQKANGLSVTGILDEETLTNLSNFGSTFIQEPLYTVTADTSIRLGPDASYPIVGTIPANTTVRVYKSLAVQGWYLVKASGYQKFNGASGYIPVGTIDNWTVFQP